MVYIIATNSNKKNNKIKIICQHIADVSCPAIKLAPLDIFTAFCNRLVYTLVMWILSFPSWPPFACMGSISDSSERGLSESIDSLNMC